MKVSLLLRVLVTASLLLVATGAIAQSGDVIISTNTSWAEGTYQLNSLTVNNGATLTVEGGSTVNVVGLITVVANSKILLQGKNTSAPINEQWIGAGVSLQAGNIQVEIGSQISADGQGYGTGLGPGAAASGDYGSGASHGGRGSGNSGPTYGSAMTPTDLGSGGRVGFPGSWSA